MSKVTTLSWKIRTGNEWWSGTDTRITVEMFRDSTLLQRANVEPGGTERLNRNNDVTHFWTFKSDSDLGTSISGFVVPFFIEFPEGVRGHLRCKFTAHGDDAWQKASIVSNVYSGEIAHIPGTIDALEWKEKREEFHFTQEWVISTDSSEGYRTVTLIY